MSAVCASCIDYIDMRIGCLTCMAFSSQKRILPQAAANTLEGVLLCIGDTAQRMALMLQPRSVLGASGLPRNQERCHPSTAQLGVRSPVWQSSLHTNAAVMRSLCASAPPGQHTRQSAPWCPVLAISGAAAARRVFPSFRQIRGSVRNDKA